MRTLKYVSMRTRSFVHPFIRSPVHPFIRSPVHPFPITHPFVVIGCSSGAHRVLIGCSSDAHYDTTLTSTRDNPNSFILSLLHSFEVNSRQIRDDNSLLSCQKYVPLCQIVSFGRSKTCQIPAKSIWHTFCH